MAQTSQILASIAAFALKNNVNTSYQSHQCSIFLFLRRDALLLDVMQHFLRLAARVFP